MSTGLPGQLGTARARLRLPDRWRQVRLGTVCRLVNGDAYKESDWSAEGLPIIRIQNLNDSSKPFNYWAGSPDGKVQVKPGDVLLAWSGTPGTSFGAHLWSGGPAVLNQHIFRVDLDSALINSRWAVLAVNWELDVLIQKSHGGVGLRHVTRREVESLRIVLPPLQDQQRILGALSRQLDAAERARAAAEERLRAASRLVPAYVESIFGNARSRHWPRKRLGELCSVRSGQVDPRLPEFCSLPHVNGENIEAARCRLTYVRSAGEDRLISGKYLFQPGDVLYSKLRPYLRKAVVAEVHGLCSADMYPIKVKPDVLDPAFLCWMLVADDFSRYADGESRRARMPKLNRRQLLRWKAVVPPLGEQRALMAEHVSRVRAVEKLETQLQDEMDKTQSLRTALLRRAFQGGL